MHSLDLVRAATEQSYEEFMGTLPEELCPAARHLPALLEPVLLSLPTLLLGSRKPKLVASAQRAHLFAMLGVAMGECVDRELFSRADLDEQMDALLLAIERQRHRALAELRMLGADRSTSFMVAERESRKAAEAERDVFERRSEASLPNFVVICAGKHSLAFPATMAAAFAAGADVVVLGHVHDAILGVALGVAARREVVERHVLARMERSWVAALAAGRERADVIAELLDLAADSFDRAAVSAQALGVDELADWARRQAEQAREQAKLARPRLGQASAA